MPLPDDPRQPDQSAARRGGLHVLVIVENVALGVDTRLRKQVRDLLAAGHQVSVITMRSDDNARYRETANLRVLDYPAPAQPTKAVGYLREYAVSLAWATLLAVRLRLRGRIDVLHVCQPPDIYFPLCWLLRLLGTRIVIDQRDLMPELLAARYDSPPTAMVRVLGWLERRSQRVAHHTLCVNEYLRDRLTAAGAPPDQISVVRNGPVLAHVDQALPEPAIKGPHRYLVCWVGKMGKQDRVDLVVRVAEHVVQVLGRRDCGFAVLGDGECLEDLRRMTATLGLEPWLSLPGWLSEGEVFSYLASADLGLDTSLQVEVSPVKAMEYMAFSLPLVCFDLQESRRIAEDAAVFVAPGDTVELAHTIVKLLDDADMRASLGAVGRRRVLDDLGWERQTPVYLSAIEHT
jgi:glycosyltransferase involved in cell wall biosynthesis